MVSFKSTCIVAIVVVMATVLTNNGLVCATEAAQSTTAQTTDMNGYNIERLKIWGARIEDVIANKLGMFCRNLVSMASTEGETPQSSCDKLRDHKQPMLYICSEDEYDAMEEAVCGYDDVVLPGEKAELSTTQSLVSASSSTSTPSPKPAAKSASSLAPPTETKPDSSSPLGETPSVDSPSSSSSTPEVSAPPPQTSNKTIELKPVDLDRPLSKSASSHLPRDDSNTLSLEQPQNTAPLPDTSLAENTINAEETDQKLNSVEQKQLISFDSRLSKSCNKVLGRLSSLISSGSGVKTSQCESLRHLGHQNGAAQSGELLGDENVILEACTHDERSVIFEKFCINTQTNIQPAHALQGQQQEHVRYVIKTGLAEKCRAALWPLGEGKLSEDAIESCETLSGHEGDELVANKVCTRDDLDSVISAVCNSAQSIAGHLSLVTVVFCMLFVFS